MHGHLNFKFNVWHTIFKMFRLLLLLLYPANLFVNIYIYIYFHAAFVMGPAPLIRQVNKLNCIICYHSAHW